MLGKLAVFACVLVNRLKQFVTLPGVSTPEMKLGQNSGVLQPGTISGMHMGGKVFVERKIPHNHAEFRISELILEEADTV